MDGKVKDYGKWKPFFDKKAPMREKAGSRGGMLFHVSGEPDHICILLEWDTKDHATGFYESEDLKKVMQDAGVIGKPEITYLDKIENLTRGVRRQSEKSPSSGDRIYPIGQVGDESGASHRS
jgi:hypothetical protein